MRGRQVSCSWILNPPKLCDTLKIRIFEIEVTYGCDRKISIEGLNIVTIVILVVITVIPTLMMV